MADSGAGYWQVLQDQLYYADDTDNTDDVDPQLLESGMWAPQQSFTIPTPQQLGQHLDQSLYLQSPFDDHGFTPLQAHSQHESTIEMFYRPSSGAYIPEHHIDTGTSSSSSHSLRPEAVEFRPSALDQEQYTFSTNPTYTSEPQLAAYGTSAIADSQPVQITDEALTNRMPAMQRAAVQYYRQRLCRLSSSHQNYSGPASIDRSNPASISPGYGSLENAMQPFDGTLPAGPIQSISRYEWQPGHAPVEDIPAWSQGAYIPAASQYSTNHLLPPLSSGPVSRQGTASIAGSAGSFYCSSEGCQKSFDKKGSLDHHERNHRPRKHACSMCDKAFVFRKDLRRHMKTHEQERHIFCTNIGCQYHTIGFQRNDHLKRHMQKVHGTDKKSR